MTYGAFGNDFFGRTGQLIEDKVGGAAGAQSATFGAGTTFVGDTPEGRFAVDGSDHGVVQPTEVHEQ